MYMSLLQNEIPQKLSGCQQKINPISSFDDLETYR
tara:strand:- start:5351 stop:5455 length:105 start_codon:yes stop_codon:yes gene_type:complete